jgi:hypothetical protein
MNWVWWLLIAVAIVGGLIGAWLAFLWLSYKVKDFW